MDGRGASRVAPPLSRSTTRRSAAARTALALRRTHPTVFRQLLGVGYLVLEDLQRGPRITLGMPLTAVESTGILLMGGDRATRPGHALLHRGTSRALQANARRA